MSFDAHKNFAYSTVATAPSPASSGTSLVVQTGDGAKFPAVPFNATVWPAGVQPLTSNAEVVRVTNISTDTFTITRAQESSSARSIVAGDQIANTITAKILTDVETAIGPPSQGMVAAQKGYATFSNAGDVLPKGSSAKTYECWGKLNGDPGQKDLYFFSQGPRSVNGDSFSFIHNGNTGVAPNLGGVFGPAVSAFTNYYEWNDSQWHHYVLTYGGGTTVQLYVDGVAAPALTVTTQNIAASQALIIGNYATNGTLGSALVDEMAVYSGALSQARVTAHFKARLSGDYSSQVLADSPIVYYRFNDAGTGTTMADSSGNGRNGTYSAQFTPNSVAINFVYGVPVGAVV